MKFIQEVLFQILHLNITNDILSTYLYDRKWIGSGKYLNPYLKGFHHVNAFAVQKSEKYKKKTDCEYRPLFGLYHGGDLILILFFCQIKNDSFLPCFQSSR